MSIQAGIWKLNDEPVVKESLLEFSQTIHHGLDAATVHISGAVGMILRPYYTTKRARSEQQPFAAKRMIVTWDGRLDNREEIIAKLGAYSRELTDVALVAEAFQLWRTDSFAFLIGDWALAIWDEDRKTLTLARDYIGVKPLFYYAQPDQIRWCSNLDTLASCGDNFTLDEEYLAGYLSFSPSSERSPYAEIHSVPPGSFVTISQRAITTERYWHFNPRPNPPCKDDAEYEEAFRVLFRQAVRCRLEGDSPILADLSGGLDSSAIVCMSHQIRAAEGPNPSFTTFSFFDPEEPDDNDAVYISAVEALTQQVGHKVPLRAQGDSFSLELARFTARPSFGVRRELTDAKSKVVNHGGYRVLISGNGGDQVSGQGLDPRVAIADSISQLALSRCVKQATEWSLATRVPGIQLLASTLALLMPGAIRRHLMPEARDLPWLSKEFDNKYRITDRLLPWNSAPRRWPPLARYNFQNLERLRGEMTHARTAVEEIRYPFLDRRLVEFLFAVPLDQLFRRGERRSLLRRSLRDILPREILERRTKSGTGRCIVLTVRKHWSEINRIINSAISVDLGYLNQAEFCSALTELHNGRTPSCVGQLARGLALEVWLRDTTARGILSIKTDASKPGLLSGRPGIEPLSAES